MFMPCPEIDRRRAARSLYWQGWRVTDIAQFFDLPRPTVEAWRTRDGWDKAPVIERVETSLEARLVQLIAKEAKDGRDFKEIDLLGRQIERLARVRRYEAPGGHEGDLNPNVERRNAGPKKRAARNAISDEQQTRLVQAFRESLFEYQQTWYAAGEQRTRVILKSRQIGATWYFAREALIDALLTGRNQIFLSASKAQAHNFKKYIQAFARQHADVELKGEVIILANGAELHFLGTNARTAQGYTGNFYFDEFFWVFGFKELNKVASGMASQKRWRRTYFSTPSSIQHEAYPFWTGDDRNRRLPKDQRVKIDTSHHALQAGALGPDRRWRQIVTIEDAERGGCDLFDVDELRFEYSPLDFDNLFLCNFVDDGESVFPLALMQRCHVDSWVVWSDFKPFAARPLGDREVWIGYDPSHTGDGAGCVVVAPPAVAGGKFRILERYSWKGMDFAAQAESIRKLTLKYRVTHIGIDATGLGTGVYQLVRQFFPRAQAYQYSPEVKSRLVLKAYDVISKGRLEYDAGWTDVAAAFMSIRKTMTASGRAMTFDAGRSEDTGHADLAWAVMHALDNEPLEGGMGGRTKSKMEIC